MESHRSVCLEAVELEIVQREAELVLLELWIAHTRLSFEGYLAASNALLMLGQELERWKAIEKRLQGPKTI
ncbi:hypothetical protein AWB77_04405 [Caballeronia fortuita]|uniref:Uncharacterized protein n=1 Tax=Caballeronia fortuita TaxID=1777138 RepID=A0A158CQ49_9BURK|nr:hypothetical protein [Caballeronia fortuita]SAK84475.1 hypothetical protein AWB77_04405 [Caballeronia fortuita]